MGSHSEFKRFFVITAFIVLFSSDAFFIVIRDIPIAACGLGVRGTPNYTSRVHGASPTINLLCLFDVSLLESLLCLREQLHYCFATSEPITDSKESNWNLT